MRRTRKLRNWEFPYNGLERGVYATLLRNALREKTPDVQIHFTKGGRYGAGTGNVDRIIYRSAFQDDKVASLTFRDGFMMAAIPENMDNDVVMGVFGTKPIRRY
jgi:hypothetical protein